LTRQRNMGIKVSQGDLICFFDDDVSIGEDFLAQVIPLFEQPDMQVVGGISGYDILHYPQPITLEWRLRYWLGTVPSMEPGDADHLGRNVPLGFAARSSGHRNVGWLPGFCMIYRRVAISNLYFDEALPTYGGEDRDFSLEVHKNWQLLLCTDLLLQHHNSLFYRDSHAQRAFQRGFGMGRSIAKRAQRLRDYGVLAHYTLGEFVIDLLRLAKRPSRENVSSAIAMPIGIIKGFRSGWAYNKTTIDADLSEPLYALREAKLDQPLRVAHSESSHNEAPVHVASPNQETS